MATSLRVLITGEDMSLGTALQEQFEIAFDFVGAGLRCASRDDVSRVVGAYRPDVIFHGIDGHVDDPAGDAGRARRADRVLGTRWMVEAADGFGARVVLLSSSAVFSSTGSHARSEWEEPDALGESALSLIASERLVGVGHTVVRIGSVQSPDSTSLLGHVMTCLEQRAPLYLSPDASGSVIFPADAADVLASVAVERLTGVVHVANAGTPSEVEFANHVLSVDGGDTSSTHPPVVNGDVGRFREPWIGTGLCCDVLAAAGITPVRPWFDSLASAFGEALISV